MAKVDEHFVPSTMGSTLLEFDSSKSIAFSVRRIPFLWLNFYSRSLVCIILPSTSRSDDAELQERGREAMSQSSRLREVLAWIIQTAKQKWRCDENIFHLN